MFVDEMQIAQAEVKQDSDVVATLKAAKALIADKSKLICETFARNVLGHPTAVLSSDAVGWCAAGALCKVQNVEPYSSAMRVGFDILNQAATYIHKRGFSVSYVNDTFGHDAVMQVFDQAIEKAEREGL